MEKYVESGVSKEEPISYREFVKQAMMRVVEGHQHDHPLYQQTEVKEFVIDEKRKIAVFILFEQIDSDRNTKHGQGWLGDEFRYSLWKMKNDSVPVRIYEDHAYIRQSVSALTRTRGRDCSLKGLKIEGDQIKVTRLKGERAEKQEPEEIILDL